MHRFFVSKEAIRNGKAVIEGEEFCHLSKVLRLTAGDRLVVFDGTGNEYHGKIVTLAKDAAEIEVTEPSVSPAESPLEVYLVQGIPKGEKMDLIVQKATELGARGIIPLQTERCVVKLAGNKREERRKRWQKVALEAAKQCGRALVPEVFSLCTIREFVQGLPSERFLFVPWEEGGASFKEVLQDHGDSCSLPVYVVIGPEGGLAVEEVREIKDAGGVPVTLGKRILRTETAGLAALAVVMFAWGDLG